MEEAQKGYAVLSDVDEGTFARFSRWVYSGCYSPAEHSIEAKSASGSPPVTLEKTQERVDGHDSNPVAGRSQPEPDLSILPPEDPAEDPAPHIYDVNDAWTSFLEPKKSKKESKRLERKSVKSFSEDLLVKDTFTVPLNSKERLKESFICLRFKNPKNKSDVPAPRINREPSEDYTEVFLSHARIHVFAEKYDIQPLKKLAIYQLHQTLAIFTLHRQRVGDVVALLRYAYVNTSEEQNDINKDLRPMLTRYIGYEMDILIEAIEFKELLEEGGSLLGDFLAMVSKRIAVG